MDLPGTAPGSHSGLSVYAMIDSINRPLVSINIPIPSTKVKKKITERVGFEPTEA